jgi:voltage-gated potassium channel
MENKSNELKTIDIFVFILSIYVLVALLVDTFLKIPKEISLLLNYFDWGICTFFILEFLFRFHKSDNKLAFMKWGWIDLLSSIPMIDILRYGRIIRLFRLIRIIRAFKTTRSFIHHFFSNKVQGALYSMVILGFLLLAFSSICILMFETLPNCNIKTAEDAIWWGYSTMATVGYGDKYPITTEGRIIAMILMTYGVGLFGSLTAYIATIFIKNQKQTQQ